MHVFGPSFRIAAFVSLRVNGPKLCLIGEVWLTWKC